MLPCNAFLKRIHRWWKNSSPSGGCVMNALRTCSSLPILHCQYFVVDIFFTRLDGCDTWVLPSVISLLTSVILVLSPVSIITFCDQALSPSLSLCLSQSLSLSLTISHHPSSSLLSLPPSLLNFSWILVGYKGSWSSWLSMRCSSCSSVICLDLWSADSTRSPKFY